jgi:hypothetical protein
VFAMQKRSVFLGRTQEKCPRERSQDYAWCSYSQAEIRYRPMAVGSMGWYLTLKTLQRGWAAFLWRIRVPRLGARRSMPIFAKACNPLRTRH